MPLVLNGTTGVQDNSGAFVAGTAVASTSGTSIDFTSIPSWVKRVTIMLNGVSTNGSAALLVQLGTSGGVTTSGYLGTGYNISGSAVNYTTGFGDGITSASVVRQGSFIISSFGSNTWICGANISTSDAARISAISGSAALAGTLDRVRITTTNGTDAFDLGSINILYE
jgi:hypothetical protein